MLEGTACIKRMQLAISDMRCATSAQTTQKSLSALTFDADCPTGKSSEGTDVALKWFMTRAIGEWPERIHANVAYTDVGSREPSERSVVLFIGAAHERPTGFEEILMVDAFLQQSERKEAGNDVALEAGIRKQLKPWSVLACGASAAVTGDVPDMTATLTYHRSF